MTLPVIPNRHLDLGAADFFKPIPQSPVGDQLTVKGGYFSTATPSKVVFVAETNTVGFDAVSASNKYRWDMVILNFGGTISIVEGTEQTGSPVQFTGAPDLPRHTAFPLAYVLIDEDVTVEIGEEDIFDIRPKIHFGDSRYVGEIKYSLVTVTEDGWLPMTGQTLGNAGSGATHANAKYKDLFNLLKTISPNLGTEVFDSGHTVIIPNVSRRFLVPRDTGDVDFDTVGETGGQETIDTTHNHDPGGFTLETVGDHSHGFGNHTHEIPEQPATNTGLDVDNNSSSQYDAGSGLTGHFHVVPEHDHGGETGTSSGTTDLEGSHTHAVQSVPNAGGVEEIIPRYFVVMAYIKY